ncbi:hypothetical protein BaRGS_00028043, partial [Batillaria attramentaria]
MTPQPQPPSLTRNKKREVWKYSLSFLNDLAKSRSQQPPEVGVEVMVGVDACWSFSYSNTRRHVFPQQFVGKDGVLQLIDPEPQSLSQRVY